MDGQRRDDQQVLIDVDKAALDAVLGLDHDAASHRQRAVQPGGHDHAAVTFDAQAGAAVVFDLLVFNFPARGIAVAGGNAPTADGMLRHAPGDDRGTVAGNVVPFAGFQVPIIGFFQAGITGCIQPGRGYGSRVVGGHCPLQKFK